MSTSTQPASLWRNRDFLLLWTGQTVSSIGSGVSQIAYPLLVLALTRSPAQAGLVSAIRTLAYIVCILPAGALVDRWDRKRVMIACDVGRAVALGSIPFALAHHHLTLLQLALTSAAEGALEPLFSIAELAALPNVVAAEQVPAAMSRN